MDERAGDCVAELQGGDVEEVELRVGVHSEEACGLCDRVPAARRVGEGEEER